jgi:hypothetical protein
MPKDESTAPGIVDDNVDEVSNLAPEQVASTEEEMSDYQRATVSEETSTDDEKPPEEKKDTPETEEIPDEKPGETSPKESKPDTTPVGVKKRINKITKEKYQAQRETEHLRESNRAKDQRIAELEAGKGLAEIEVKEPNRDDFEEDADFHKAFISWATTRQFAEEKANSVKPPEPETAVASPEQATQEEIDTIMDMGRQTYPDFDKVVIEAEFMPDIVIREAYKLDSPQEVIYEIANNKELADNLKKMNAFGISEEISRIASTLGSPEETKPKPKITKKISNAPAPIKPSTGNTSVSEKSLDELGHAAYRKKRGLLR